MHLVLSWISASLNIFIVYRSFRKVYCSHVSCLLSCPCAGISIVQDVPIVPSHFDFDFDFDDRRYLSVLLSLSSSHPSSASLCLFFRVYSFICQLPFSFTSS